MESAGLDVAEIDGINPWNSLGHWPRLLPLLAFARILNRLPLLPAKIRQKWGIDLMAVGKKNK
jgi:hypothetical protein